MTDIIRTEWNHSNVFFASDYQDIDAIMKFKMLTLAPHQLLTFLIPFAKDTTVIASRL